MADDAPWEGEEKAEAPSQPQSVSAVPPLTERIGALLPPSIECALRRRVVRLLPWRVPLAVLTGPLAGTRRHARLLMAGPPDATAYWESRVFADPPRRKNLGAVPRFELPARLASLRDEMDMTLARLDVGDARSLPSHEYLQVPEWITARAPVPASVDDLGRERGSVAEDLRRTRRAAVTCRVSHRRAEFEAFYRDMYLPHIAARHGAEAYAYSRRRLARAFGRGGLLVLERAGEPVAGHLFEPVGEALHSVAVGVRGGDAELVRSGVAAALYVHLFSHARAAGYREIDMRGTRPSLRDGLLRYKRKWGAVVQPKDDVTHVTCVHWHDLAGVAGDIVDAHPMVFALGGGLHGLTVLREGADTSLDRLREELWVPGLRSLVVAASDASVDASLTDDRTIVLPRGRHDPASVHAAVLRHMSVFGATGER